MIWPWLVTPGQESGDGGHGTPVQGEWRLLDLKCEAFGHEKAGWLNVSAAWLEFARQQAPTSAWRKRWWVGAALLSRWVLEGRAASCESSGVGMFILTYSLAEDYAVINLAWILMNLNAALFYILKNFTIINPFTSLKCYVNMLTCCCHFVLLSALCTEQITKRLLFYEQFGGDPPRRGELPSLRQAGPQEALC